MAKMGVTLDGTYYAVWIEFNSMDRSFSFVEGVNQTVAINGADILDTLGTKYSYEFNVYADPNNRAAYDDFYWAISSPNRIHTIILPFGQSTIEFQCRVNSGRDKFKGNQGTSKLWDGLSVSVTPIKPQRSNNE